MLQLLKQPFPALSEFRHRLMSSLLFGLFVFLFLYIFRPFGLVSVEGNILLITLSYGLVTLFCMLLIQIGLVRLLPEFYNEDSWTVRHELVHTLAVILLVAIGNVLWSSYLNFFRLSWGSFLTFIGFTLAVGIIPVIIQILIRLNVHQRRHLKKSEQINKGMTDAELITPPFHN